MEGAAQSARRLPQELPLPKKDALGCPRLWDALARPGTNSSNHWLSPSLPLFAGGQVVVAGVKVAHATVEPRQFI